MSCVRIAAQPTTQAAIDRVNEQAKLVAGGLAQKIYGLFDKDSESADDAKQDIDEAADERAPMIARINQIASGTVSDKPILEIQFEGISAGINAVPMGLDVSSAIIVPGVTDSDSGTWDPMILSVSRGTLGTHTNPVLKLLHKIPTTMFRQEMVF